MVVTSRLKWLFIQFAGFTFGKSASAYATPWHGYPGNNNSFLMGGHDTVTGVNNIQYTAQFGNGVSATIGLDDPTVFNRTSVLNLGVAATPAAPVFNAAGIQATAAGANSYGGTHAPDIVGNIRVDQAWGLFQISGAAHLVNASYNVVGTGGVPNGLSEVSGHPDDKWGGSVMAAFADQEPPDRRRRRPSRSTSATPRVTPRTWISTSGASPSFAMFGGTNRPGAYQRHRLWPNVLMRCSCPGSLPVVLPGDIKLTEAWGVRGAFNHKLGSLLVDQPLGKLRCGSLQWQCN